MGTNALRANAGGDLKHRIVFKPQKFNQIYKAFEAAAKKITTAQQTLNHAAALVKIAACECLLLAVSGLLQSHHAQFHATAFQKGENFA